MLILHIAEPKWKIDSISIALLVIAALPWLGEILESVDLPGGGGFKYRQRIESVEGKARDVEREVAALRAMLPILTPPYLMDHLVNLHSRKTARYQADEQLINNLRSLRGMSLIELLPAKRDDNKGIGSLAECDGSFDLADWVRLTQEGEEWVRLAADFEKEQPRDES